jgi:hypothetical protein
MSLKSRVQKFFGKPEKAPSNDKLMEQAAALAQSSAEHLPHRRPIKRWCTKPKERPRTRARAKRKRLRQLEKQARAKQRRRAKAA